MADVLHRIELAGADLVWATARPSAVGFYQRSGFEVGAVLMIQPTGATMHYVWCTLSDAALP